MDRLFYKLSVQGIVYLVDPTTSIAYTYYLSNPTEIGKIVWTDSKDLPRIDLHSDWQTRITAKNEGCVPTPLTGHNAPC